MILASMLAMVMLAASPALAQTQSSEQNASGSGNFNQLSQQCQNVIGDINIEGGDQTAVADQDATAESGDATAEAQYDSEANAESGDPTALNASEIAQEQDITVNIAQTCIQEAQQANVDIDVEAPAAPAPAPDDDQYEAPAPDDDQYEAPADDQYVAPEDDAAAGAGAGAAAPAGDDDAAAVAPAEAEGAEGGAVAVLPDTGGASLFTLGAGALLVAGGLLARRIVR